MTAAEEDQAEGPATGRGPSRQAEATRRALIEAAFDAFAQHGYEAASVRAITAEAEVNQGAITYHFGGKDGLYRAVLEEVRDTLAAQPLLDPDGVGRHDRDEVLRLFIRQVLAPLAEGERVRRCLSVLAWEQLRPTGLRRRFSAEQPFPTVVLAERIVRLFRPAGDDRTVAIATAWLMGQIITFVRDGEYLSAPPFNLDLGAAAIDGIVDDLVRLCRGGLSALAPP